MQYRAPNAFSAYPKPGARPTNAEPSDASGARMIEAVRSVFSLLLGAGLMALGVGLVGMVLPLRMNLEAVSPQIAGYVMSAYYAGFVIGSLTAMTSAIRPPMRSAGQPRDGPSCRPACRRPWSTW